MTDNPYESPEGVESAKSLGTLAVRSLVILSIVATIAAFLLPATRRGREPARRTHCLNNVRQIILAMHNYSDVYGGFPPAYTVDQQGQPLHSWRTLLLPYVDEKALYESIDLSKPWDDPVNVGFAAEIPPVYRCPSAVIPDGHTTYVALVGDDLFLHPTKLRKISEINDGFSNTLAVLDVPVADSVPWMAPDDTDGQPFFTLSEETEVSHPGVMLAARADGSVYTISASEPGTKRRALTTIDGGEMVLDE